MRLLGKSRQNIQFLKRKNRTKLRPEGSQSLSVSFTCLFTIEREIYWAALRNRLWCERLEQELKVKPEFRNQILSVWGVDKKSGVESSGAPWFVESTMKALLETSEKEKADERFIARDDYRGRIVEASEYESERTEFSKNRKRNAIRSSINEKESISGRRPYELV